MAWPLVPVTAVAEVEKVPEAPVPGGVKVAVAPETGLPYCVGHRGDQLVGERRVDPALCPLPEVTLTVSGRAHGLVRAKFIVGVPPGVEAETL